VLRHQIGLRYYTLFLSYHQLVLYLLSRNAAPNRGFSVYFDNCFNFLYIKRNTAGLADSSGYGGFAAENQRSLR
jgi:hypothetical protein